MCSRNFVPINTSSFLMAPWTLFVLHTLLKLVHLAFLRYLVRWWDMQFAKKALDSLTSHLYATSTLLLVKRGPSRKFHLLMLGQMSLHSSCRCGWVGGCWGVGVWGCGSVGMWGVWVCVGVYRSGGGCVGVLCLCVCVCVCVLGSGPGTGNPFKNQDPTMTIWSL